MPDPISKIAGQFGIVRLNADNPLVQTQRTPSLPSSAIAPALPPLGQRRQGAATTPPRADMGIDRLVSEGEATAEAAAPHGTGPSTITSDANLPPLLKAMTRASPDLGPWVRDIFGSRMQSTDMLAETMYRLDVSRGVEAVPGLPSAPVVLLTLALAAGSRSNAADALRGLQVLGEMDVANDIANAWRQRAANIGPDASGPSRTPEMDAGSATAWRALAALATTPDGLTLSQSLLKRPIKDSQASDVSLLLKAATVAATEAGIGLDPIALLRRPATGQTLAGAALLCAAARIAGDLAAATPHSWALAAVRNDLMSDGPGSDFASINDRLMKMGRWVERATSSQEAMVRYPMREKSPFRALRHGVQNVDRGAAIGRHKVARDQALLTAASALRDHLAMTPLPSEAPDTTSIPAALLREAVLQHCLADADAGGLERAGFDEDALTDIAAHLAHRLTFEAPTDEAPAETIPQLLALPEVQALADLRLDEATLSRWTDDALQVRGDAPPESGVGNVAPAPLNIARTALQTARDEALGRDTRVVEINRETVRAALQDIVQNIEGSSRLRLSAGGISGVGLRQITSTINALASALFLRGRVDARLQHGRQAVFEIAMPPYAVEIVLATQRQSKRNIGLGAFIGPDMGVGKVGLNVDATLWASERNQLAGICLRLPRVGRAVSALREDFSRLVDHLLDGSTGGIAMAPQSAATMADLEAARADAHPLLRQLLQAFPDLTVTQIADGGDSRRRHGLGVDLAGSVGAGGFKASGNVGAYAEGHRNITRHYVDASGSLRVVRSLEGKSNRAGVAARAALGAGRTHASTTGNAGRKEVSVFALPVALGAECILGGSYDRRETVYEDGRLHPLSFVEREYHDVDEFLEQIKHELPDWLAAGAPPARLQQLLDEIKTHIQPTHTFALRWIVTPEMKARDDAYRSTIALLETLPNSADTVSALREAVEAQWHDQQCMQPFSIRTYENQLRQQTRGVDLVAQLVTVDTAGASHIDNRLDVKPRTQVARPSPVLTPSPDAVSQTFIPTPVNPLQPMWSPPSRGLLPVLGSLYDASDNDTAPARNAMLATQLFPADRLDLRRDIEELQQQQRSAQAAEAAGKAKAPD